MLVTCLLFALSLVLVIKGGDLFVDAASAIARAAHIPTFIIGATIVSLATTMPEMLVSLTAALEGKVDMAVGNAVGSVTANTALILAVAMLAMHIPSPRRQFGVQLCLLIAVAAVLCVSCCGGVLSRGGSVALIVLFAVFMTRSVLTARTDPGASSGADAEAGPMGPQLLRFALGAAGIVAGSRLMVSSGSAIAAWLGVPERVVAVTLVAVGTSLPELVTTVTAIVKKESGLSIGNIIGANIIDLSLILPVCSLASGEALPVSAQSAAFDLPVCLGVTLLAAVPLLVRQKAARIQGALLLAAYAAYLYLVL